jgi:nicastrin
VSGAVIGAKNIDEFVGLIDEEGYTSDPVALVIDQTLLNKENLVKATKRYNIAGILVTDSADNFGYSPDRKSNFNIYGDGLRFERFQFPMFYIRAVDQIERLYRFSDFNKDSASRGKFLPYVVQFTFPALASQNSQTCLDNLKCFPVGDFSVWSTLSSSIQNSKEIVLVSTQLDSTSWFPYVGAPGAEAAASSSAALFGVAASLSQLSKELIESLPRQIFISFFQAESFDNIGSRRFIFDVDSFVCSKASKDGTACSQPIRTSLDFKKFSISNITRHFSISQIGLNNSSKLFIMYKSLTG